MTTSKSLIVALVVLLTIGNVSANLNLKHQDLFGSWKLRFKKNYGTVLDEAVKYETFTDNYEFILNFNKENADVQLALNEFADLTPEEFRTQYLNFNPDFKDPAGDDEFNMTTKVDVSIKVDVNGNQNFLAAAEPEPEPEPVVLGAATSINWVTKGAVTSVKNQKCGNCWSYSGAGSLEAYYFLKKGKLVELSSQQLSDCTTTCSGCNGCGGLTQTLAYSAKNGIETLAAYPLTTSGYGSCKYSSAKVAIKNTGYKSVTRRSVSALKTALNIQPVQVAIQADQRVFQFYSSGVIQSGCGASLNHAVLAVGYGSYKGVDAFYVKNSWGTSWGINGFVYISTSATANSGNGVCGILQMAAYPV